jgi:hypothetical protein
MKLRVGTPSARRRSSLWPPRFGGTTAGSYAMPRKSRSGRRNRAVWGFSAVCCPDGHLPEGRFGPISASQGGGLDSAHLRTNHGGANLLVGSSADRTVGVARLPKWRLFQRMPSNNRHCSHWRQPTSPEDARSRALNFRLHISRMCWRASPPGMRILFPAASRLSRT